MGEVMTLPDTPRAQSRTEKSIVGPVPELGPIFNRDPWPALTPTRSQIVQQAVDNDLDRNRGSPQDLACSTENYW